MNSLSIHPPKRLLFGPGPTMVDARVYHALAQPVVGHLDPYFFEVLADSRRLLRQVFGTANEFTIALSGTGSAGMEAAVGNFVEPGSKFAVFCSGFFAERLAEMGRRQNAEVVTCQKPWGETFTAEEADRFLDREKPSVVAFVHAETSTGALQSPKAITEAAHRAGALVIADTVTSLGALAVDADEKGIDIAYSCTQKGLSCPPGLSPFTASAKAMERLRARKHPLREWYLDLRLLSDYYDGRKYHHTASSALHYALREGLQVIAEEGLQQRFDRHLSNHRILVQGFEALGLNMLVKEGQRIPNLNTPKLPEGVDDVRVRKHLLEQQGIEVAGGFGPLQGKILRVGLMGSLSSPECVDLLLNALSEAIAA